MTQRVVYFLQKEPILWGPLSLLCTVAIGVKTSIPFDLLFIAAAGFFLCARWQLRGCCYSLILLGIAALIKHAFLISDHLWQLGLEGSLASAFFITALAFEQGTARVESLESQIQTRAAALGNLEEEISKVQEAAQQQQIAFQEKTAALQKELEDLQADHSSILILNEVLRKTTARESQENEIFAANLLDLQRQKEHLKAECEAYHKDLSRLENTDAMAIQNKQLMKELNAARYEKEQTHLINETLAHLYARENLKAKEADEEAASLTDQLRAARGETQKMHLSQIEPLFKQLKKQFEEKNQILHQTRSDLFKSDTELQKLKMEKAALELHPIPREIERELQGLGSQVLALEEENQQLQELVSILSENSGKKPGA